ncbi:hypothetical protein BH09PSE3_BH09PSE3_16740 [soil metagenome]
MWSAKPIVKGVIRLNSRRLTTLILGKWYEVW